MYISKQGILIVFVLYFALLYLFFVNLLAVDGIFERDVIINLFVFISSFYFMIVTIIFTMSFIIDKIEKLMTKHIRDRKERISELRFSLGENLYEQKYRTNTDLSLQSLCLGKIFPNFKLRFDYNVDLIRYRFAIIDCFIGINLHEIWYDYHYENEIQDVYCDKCGSKSLIDMNMMDITIFYFEEIEELFEDDMPDYVLHNLVYKNGLVNKSIISRKLSKWVDKTYIRLVSYHHFGCCREYLERDWYNYYQQLRRLKYSLLISGIESNPGPAFLNGITTRNSKSYADKIRNDWTEEEKIRKANKEKPNKVVEKIVQNAKKEKRRNAYYRDYKKYVINNRIDDEFDFEYGFGNMPWTDLSFADFNFMDIDISEITKSISKMYPRMMKYVNILIPNLLIIFEAKTWTTVSLALYNMLVCFCEQVDNVACALILAQIYTAFKIFGFFNKSGKKKKKISDKTFKQVITDLKNNLHQDIELQNSSIDFSDPVSLLVSSAISIFFIVVLAKIPSKNDFDSIFNRCGKFAYNIKGIKDIVALYQDVFKKLKSYSEGVDLSPLNTEYKEMVDKIVNMTKSDNWREIHYDLHKIQELEELMKKSWTFLTTIQRSDHKLYTDYVFYHRTLTKLYEESLNSPNRGATFRKEPAVIRLVGKPGVGKTTLTWLLSISICGALKIKQWKEAVYFRQHGKKYWQNFNAVNHRVVVFDEANQIRPDFQESIPFAGELIHLCNNAVCSLDVAECNLKAYAYFNADAILMTDNVRNPRLDDVITCPDAYKRRIQLSIEPKIKPEYGYLYSDSNGESYYRIDPSKVSKGKFLTNVYLFDIIGMNGEVLETNLEYDEIAKRVKDLLQDHDNKHKRMLETFDEFAKHELDLQYSLMTTTFWLGPFGLCYYPWYFLMWWYRIYAYYAGYYGKASMHAVATFRVIDYVTDVKTSGWIQWIKAKTRRFIMIHIYLCTESLCVTLFVGGVYNVYSYCISDKLQNLSYEKVEFWLRKNFKYYLLITVPIIVYWLYNYLKGKKSDEEKDNIDFESFQDKDDKIGKRNANVYNLKQESFQEKDNKITRKDNVQINLKHESTTEKLLKLVPESFQEKVDKITQKGKTVLNLRHENAETSLTLESDFNFEDNIETIPFKEIYNNQNTREVIDNKVIRNLYKMSAIVWIEGEGYRKASTNILMVCGKIALVNTHMIDLIKDKTIVIENANNRFEFRPNEFDYRVIYREDVRSDVAFLVFKSNNIHYHKSLVAYFPSNEQFRDFKAAYSVMIGYAASEDERTMLIKLRSGESSVSEKGIISSKGVYSHLIYSNFYTTKGDCGSPYIIFDKKKPYFILGIHIGSSKGIAMAQFVSKEMIEMALNEFDVKFTFHHAETSWNEPIEVEEKFDYNEIFEERFYPIGTMKNKIFCAEKSSINPSIIHGKVSEPVTKPAKLKNEPGLNVFKKNLSKYFVDHPRIQPQFITLFKEHVRTKIPKWRYRELTMEEIVRGHDDLNLMNRKSAPGIPWSFRSKGTGKYEWLGKEEDFILDHPAVLKRVADYEELVKQGQIPVVFVVDQTKDERRPIAKVDEGKTRFFGFAPFDFTIIVRKHLGAYLENMLSQKIDNSVLIGVNATGDDWTHLYKNLTKVGGYGNNYIAGDHSNFDGMLNSEYLFAIFEVLIEQMEYDKSDRQRIENLIWSFAINIVNSVHVFQGHVYQLSNSQFSGNPLTTILNSLYNSGLLNVAILASLAKRYRETQETEIRDIIRDVYKHYYDVVYGDDNCVAFSDEMTKYLNLDYLCEFMAEQGHIYTVDTKDSTKFSYRRIEDISILKRKFRYDPVLNYCFAPLDLNSVLEILNWDKEDQIPKKKEQLKVNVDNVYRELVHHDRETYEKWTGKIDQVLKDEGLERILVPNWQQAQWLMTGKI